MQKASLNQIKLLRKLLQRKHREKEHLFLVEGERGVEQVLESEFIDVVSVFVEEGQESSFQFGKNISLCVLEKSLIGEISDTENPQGILALCTMPKPVSIESLVSSQGVIIATDAIQDPGNLGTMIRTASWFGAKGILLGIGTVDMFNPKVVRSTVGATGSLPFLSGNMNDLLHQFENNGWNVLLLDGNKGATPINQINRSEKTILVAGNEANGISKELISQKRTRALIPSKNPSRTVESLNAAVALSIALWSVHN